MNTKLMLLATALCVALTGLAIAEPVTTTDFQGDVKVEQAGDMTKETRIGKWQYGAGGILEGEAVLDVAGSDYTLTKRGTLESSAFQGEITIDESVNQGVSLRKESLKGREILTDGGIFEGEIVKENETRGDYKKDSLVKTGKLVSAAFQGDLALDEYSDPKRSLRKQSLNGTWYVSPDLVLSGDMVITTDNGVVSVVDGRKQVVTAPVSGAPVEIQPALAKMALNAIEPGVLAVTNPTPDVTSLTPNMGNGTTLITINGTDFGEYQGTMSRLYIREYPGEGEYGQWDVPAFGGSWTNTQITFPLARSHVFSELSDRQIRFFVWREFADGSITCSNIAYFNLRNSPWLANLVPASGPVGSEVVLTGLLFGATRGTGKVNFGTTPAVTYSNWDNFNIQCAVPNLPGDPYSVTVVDSNGRVSEAKSFTVSTVSPNITSLSSTSGAPGARLQANGTNFGLLQGTGTLKFGNTPGNGSWGWSDTHAMCSIPSIPAGVYPITVTAGAGTSNAVNFTVLPAGPPVITGITPAPGYPTQQFTIRGTNFCKDKGLVIVSFGAVSTAAQVTSWSDTEVKFISPVVNPGTYNAIVKNFVGTGGNSSVFSVVKPVITGFSPKASGKVNSQVYVLGSNLSSAFVKGTVKVGTVTAVTTEWAANLILFTVPASLTPGKSYPVTVTIEGSTSNSKNFSVTR